MAERPIKKTSAGSLKQFNASADELAAAGLDLENLGTHTIRRNSNDIVLTDPNVGSLTLNQLRSTVRASSNDSTPGVLIDKIVAGTGVTITELNDSLNETIEISAVGVSDGCVGGVSPSYVFMAAQCVGGGDVNGN